MTYAANLTVLINKYSTISLFDTAATISCMPKAGFDKLQPKPAMAIVLALSEQLYVISHKMSTAVHSL